MVRTTNEKKTMVWIYKHESHLLYHNDKLVTNKGYSGKGEHKNRHSSQYVRDWGPIPVGLYEITAPFPHPKTGPFSMRLNPVCGTCLGERSAFMIHGDSQTDPGNASNGCIVLHLPYRKQIWNSGDRMLRVEHP
ncbi:tlde1 domain-containing protein [Paraburkholderia sp. 40]|uniref:tlde1 domain-containing protein n=1 Tax=Paraburkholderia sp. 40 TaxID=2991059 RepID=UPI003D1C58E1